MVSKRSELDEYHDITVCSTCLSTDRRTIRINQLGNTSASYFGITDMDIICWECEAILKRFQLFKTQVWKAQMVLKLVENKLDVKCLSKLTTSNQLAYDQEYIFNEEIKPEIEEYTELNDPSDIDDDKPLVEITPEPLESKPKVKKRKLKEGRYTIRSMSEEESHVARERDRNTAWYKRCPFKCEGCILGYHDKKLLDQHNSLKHDEKIGNNVCDICTTRFPSKDLLDVHRKSHFEYYYCKCCDYKHHKLKFILRHYMKEHDIDKKFVCKICSMECRSFRALRYHKERKHKVNPKCDHCGKVFPNETNLKRHMQIHTGLELYECEICKKNYRGEWGLRSHMRVKHEAPMPREDAYCAECDLQFRNVYLYKSHLRKNSKHILPEYKKHECPDCGKKFLEKIFLKQHYDGVHLKKREHVCHICCKMYVKAYSLRQHINLIHEGKKKPRNNTCDICEKRFTSKTFLRQHLNSHTGDRPFQCTHCAASFGYSSALYMHNKLIHLKMKRNGKKDDVNT